MNTSTTLPSIDPIAELTTAVKLSRQLAAQACADISTATPILIDAIRHGSGESRKIEALLWSSWNDHAVNLCDNLSGLDARLAQAAVAMIAARAHMGGDADGILQEIIQQSGSQPPQQPAND